MSESVAGLGALLPVLPPASHKEVRAVKVGWVTREETAVAAKLKSRNPSILGPNPLTPDNLEDVLECKCNTSGFASSLTTTQIHRI
jgi:hypothetical protein